ncbi:MAG TPA: LuxR C-terminal-related transcriptional regulator [Candidatus Dormibacteraeota bacterium]|nr:LuxR C-terminal-related transcriptional regulator [Candidatus Dormibacteraeota bacterium]
MARLPEGTFRSLPHQVTNIPHYLTTFVGRNAEISALKSLLATSRLVTLIGAGGSGKTRLAAELGRACLGLWPGGVWWVELAPVDDPLQVSDVVATALQLPGRGQTQDVVAALLAARRAVLFLDNCEHLVAACAEFCRAALQSCPELTVIATSREALGVAGEVRWPVSSMPAADAVQLFEARAQLIVPDYKVTPGNLETVTQICEHLDGMPLAIELAAARLDMLTEQELLSQLSDRFGLLKAPSRTAPERHQTMIATIDWSYRLLNEDEALLFRRLSVFRGGFTLESAQAVCADGIVSVLDALAGLVRKSMVVAERAEGQRSRYRLLESQLAYAEGRLQATGQLELTRRRHYEYFRESLAARTLWPPTPNRAPGFPEWFFQESGNLWAALAWARNNADDLGLSIAVDFGPRDFTQRRRLVADLLSRSPTQGTVRVGALCHESTFALAQGDYRAGLQAAESAVAIAREVGDVEWVAWALNCLGSALRCRGDLDAAAEINGEASSLLKGSTNLRLLRVVRGLAAFVAIDRGDYLGVTSILAECVATARSEGDVFWLGVFLDGLARAQLGMNDHQAAIVGWKEALSICRRINNFIGIVDCLDSLSCTAAATADDYRALRLAAAASRLAGEWSLRPDPWLDSPTEAAEKRARSRLGARKSEEAWNEGWALSADQAIDYALGQSEPQPGLDAGPLSRRELEVVKLVAAGLTNRQIAGRLFIAERTVDNHLEHVREKLAVKTRAQIAAWVVQRGLAPGPATDQSHPRTEAKSRTGIPPSGRS